MKLQAIQYYNEENEKEEYPLWVVLTKEEAIQRLKSNKEVFNIDRYGNEFLAESIEDLERASTWAFNYGGADDVHFRSEFISDFMGYEKVVDHYIVEGFGKYLPEDMQYFQSWDWIIPVVQKCFEIDIPEDSNLHGDITHALVDLDINELFNSVLNFIAWYTYENGKN